MRRVQQVAGIFVLCLAGAGITHSLRSQYLHAERPEFKEFTLIRAETSRGTAPVPFVRKVLIAQRADGSRVEGEVVGASTIPPRRSVWLVPDRIRVEVNDLVRAKTTFNLPGSAVVSPPAPDPQCGFSRLAGPANPVFKGEAEIFGFKTVEIQTEQQIGSESYLRAESKAPDLGCTVLRVIEDRRDSTGKITGHFELHQEKLTLDTPAPKLFEVPDEYTELSPSQMYAAVLRSTGTEEPTSESTRRRLEREDQQYMKSRETGSRK